MNKAEIEGVDGSDHVVSGEVDGLEAGKMVEGLGFNRGQWVVGEEDFFELRSSTEHWYSCELATRKIQLF